MALTVVHSLHHLWPVLAEDSCLALELPSPCDSPQVLEAVQTYNITLTNFAHNVTPAGTLQCHVLKTKLFGEAQFTLVFCSPAY